MRIPIKDWAYDDRPREKFVDKGAQAVSTTELLAILICNGNSKQSAIDIAAGVFQYCNNNLAELSKFSIKDLMRIPGIGQARAVAIAASLELGRRRNASRLADKPKITNSRDAMLLVAPLLRDKPQELFCIVLLNRANRAIHTEIISSGGITATVADPRIIFKKAIECGATGLILAHNHPSGNPSPSAADEALTLKIKSAAALFDISLYDHLIIAEQGCYSFSDAGLL
jgi:DNA repair protein RadC